MADRVEVIVLVDNYIDIFLHSTDFVHYPVPGNASRLWAEQGLALWIEVHQKKEVMKILYDFGRSNQVLFHNTKILGLELGELNFLVLSHGHIDHYGGLLKVLKETKEQCKLIIHPESCTRERYIQLEDGRFIGPFKINNKRLKLFRQRIITNRNYSELGLGVFTTGEIKKKNNFEKGMPNAYMKIGYELIHDRIEDDQSLFIDLEGKGIIVLTGCCHAGLVNTLNTIQNMFPKQKIYALIGGFHLNQAREEQLERTIDYLSQLDIQYLSGFHCTGYYTQKLFMEQFKERWIPSTVGVKMIF